MNNEDNRECDVQDMISEDCDFMGDADAQRENIRKKHPKRVLHFSDGILEEYSEDEVDAVQNKDTVVLDPTTLDWLPWTWYQTTWIGSKMLEGCDYLGECLASFFGITAPKYQFEIDEYNKIQALKTEKDNKNQLEMKGWNNQNKSNVLDSSNAISKV